MSCNRMNESVAWGTSAEAEATEMVNHLFQLDWLPGGPGVWPNVIFRVSVIGLCARWKWELVDCAAQIVFPLSVVQIDVVLM